MTVFEFNIEPNHNALIRRALAKKILRQREIEEEEASTEEDESFLGTPIARRKQTSGRQGSQGIHEDAEQTNTTAISVTVTQPNGATTTASRAAAEKLAGRLKGGDENGQDEVATSSSSITAAAAAATTRSPTPSGHSSHGDGMKHKSRWKSEYLRATSESSQTDRGSSPIDPVADVVRGEGMDIDEGGKAGDGGGSGGGVDDDNETSVQQHPRQLQQKSSDASTTTALDGADAAGSLNIMSEGGGGSTNESSTPQPDPVEQAILGRLDELRKEKTRLFQQFKEAIARKSAIAAAAAAAAVTSAVQGPPAMPLEGTTTSNPDAMNTAIKDDPTARQLSRNEVEVSYPSDQKIDKSTQESRKKLEVEIPRDRHSPGAEVPPSLSSATSTASSATPYSPVHSHSSHLPSDRDRHYPSSSPTTTTSTTSSSSPLFISPGKGGIKRPRSDSPPPLSTLSHEGPGGGGGGSGPGPRRRPRHFDDRPPRASGTGGSGADAATRKPLPSYPGLPSKPQIRQPYPGGGGGGGVGGVGGLGGKYGEPGRDRGGNMEGKHALPRRPFVDENRGRGGAGGPSGANAGSSGPVNAGGGGPYARGAGGSGGGGGGGGGGGHNSLPDRPPIDYRPVLGGPQGRPLPFSRSMMQMPRPGGFLPGRPPTLMRPVWPRRGSRS
ncbi:hypothetical protein DFQ27_007728 [Actinomortierella ambigua]|uniref:Uncharacterized protein n=1 Tax=Actinomortierella ambigua TaxID=1343610 RepID=A0A9P6TZR1_9FUNG|nr:hypothetical protein DFQ27_007728 [Actinomortierella ambigua]